MNEQGFDELRRKAEEQLTARDRQIEDIDRADLASLAHELAVHQVELEIQNEELRQSRTLAEEARDHYLDLFDFAPVGYFTLDEHSRIVEANLTGCRLLQVDRRKLLNKHFTKFIAANETDGFYFHRKKALENDTGQTFELKMQKADGTLFYVQLDSTKAGEERLRIALSDITERKKSEEALNQYREHLEELVAERTNELRELAHRLVDTQEKERTTISNNLHDEIGQLLTYTTLLIDEAIRKKDGKLLPQAATTVREAISQIRDLSKMLSPGVLRRSGLSMAIGSLVEEFEQHTNVKADFDHADGPEKVPEDVALASYRIVQEALTNVARHAKASGVRVLLSHQPSKLVLEVTDNGVGFDPKTNKHSVGLTGMGERAFALGGKLTISSNRGQGTRIVAELPVAERQNT